jgi:hypothetical protein
MTPMRIARQDISERVAIAGAVESLKPGFNPSDHARPITVAPVKYLALEQHDCVALAIASNISAKLLKLRTVEQRKKVCIRMKGDLLGGRRLAKLTRKHLPEQHSAMVAEWRRVRFHTRAPSVPTVALRFGLIRALAHWSTRLGKKIGRRPQYPSLGGPILIAGEQYFATVE